MGGVREHETPRAVLGKSSSIPRPPTPETAMIESSLRVRDDLVAESASNNMLLTASSTATG